MSSRKDRKIVVRTERHKIRAELKKDHPEWLEDWVDKLDDELTISQAEPELYAKKTKNGKSKRTR